MKNILMCLSFSLLVPVMVGASVKPKLISSSYTEENTDGISYEEVKDLCNQNKNFYKEQYFVVYCVFHEKNWVESRLVTRFYNDYRFLGLMKKAISYRNWHYYKQVPIFRSIEVPYTATESWDERIWGLDLYGWGDVKGPETILFTDDKIELTKRRARIECRKLMIQLDNDDFKYYHAKCRAKKVLDKGFVFEAYTHNPIFL